MKAGSIQLATSATLPYCSIPTPGPIHTPMVSTCSLQVFDNKVHTIFGFKAFYFLAPMCLSNQTAITMETPYSRISPPSPRFPLQALVWSPWVCACLSPKLAFLLSAMPCPLPSTCHPELWLKPYLFKGLHRPFTTFLFLGL